VASLGFKEIAEILREEIETGEFRPGALVSSETTLCARWGVSRTTIRRALGILEAESLITAIPGRGRVVRSTSEPAAMEGESRAAFIARVLREEFRRGEVSNGAVTTSTAVAERFAVSEATARDALKALAVDGLVTMAPGRGWHWLSGDTPLSKTDEIIRKLCDAITDGTWKIGERIPSELTLAAEYGVGRVTVRRAISRLVGEGVLATRTGIGTVVLRHPEP
jgi:DNA-binding GntR family transcriptional regulator